MNLHLYNSDNQIQKFKDVYAIMDHHFHIRYGLYDKRKQYLLNILENKIKILESKVRFINEIIDETITIYKKTKADIIDQLYKKEYLLYQDNIITETKNSDISKINNDYDYLIKMPLYSLSQDKIDELEKELETNKKEHATIFSKSIEDMWLEELSILKQKLKRFYMNN